MTATAMWDQQVARISDGSEIALVVLVSAYRADHKVASNWARPRFPKIVALRCRSRDIIDETTEGSD